MLTLILSVGMVLAPHRALADEPCCDEAHGFRRSSPLFLGMPVDLDTGQKIPGRHGFLVPVDCGKRVGIWAGGAKLEQVGYLDNGYKYGG